MTNEDALLFAKADDLHDAGEFQAAFAIFRALAEQGDTSAMTRLALMYDLAQGTEYSFEQSVYWDMKAAELGNPVAYFNLGVTYRRAGDVRTARHWYLKALEAEDGEAALELAKMYLISDKETQSATFYLQRALEDTKLLESSRFEATKLLAELTNDK